MSNEPEIPKYETAEAKGKLSEFVKSRPEVGAVHLGPSPRSPTDNDSDMPFRLFFYAVQQALDATDGAVRVKVMASSQKDAVERKNTLLQFQGPGGREAFAFTDEQRVSVGVVSGGAHPKSVEQEAPLPLRLDKRTRMVVVEAKRSASASGDDAHPATILIEAVLALWR